MQIGWRFDWVLTTVLQKKRQPNRSYRHYSTNIHSNEENKSKFKADFIDVHQYIKEIARL
jgi:hypothetical protein